MVVGPWHMHLALLQARHHIAVEVVSCLPTDCSVEVRGPAGSVQGCLVVGSGVVVGWGMGFNGIVSGSWVHVVGRGEGRSSVLGTTPGLTASPHGSWPCVVPDGGG